MKRQNTSLRDSTSQDDIGIHTSVYTFLDDDYTRVTKHIILNHSIIL